MARRRRRRHRDRQGRGPRQVGARATCSAATAPASTSTWEPLVWLLTPHKLFRRSFLDAHDLRFPEGRRRLEDHVMRDARVLHASRASRCSPTTPVTTGCCATATSTRRWGRLDPQSYFEFMREVLDIVDEHTEPGPFRDRLYARWYRGKMLNRVEKIHSNPDVSRRRAALRGDARAGGRALPRRRRRVPAVQPPRALAAAARRRLRRAGGAAGLRVGDEGAGARDRGAAGRRRRRGDAGGRADRPALRARRRAASCGARSGSTRPTR